MADVVQKLICPHRGAAHALRNRAKQLVDLISASKQYMQTLREATTPRKIHGSGSLRLIDAIPGDKNSLVNDLLAPDGLQTILEDLVSLDSKTAPNREQSHQNNASFTKQVLSFNEELINLAALMDNSRLGKTQEQQEQKVCEKANAVNRAIKGLQTTCTDSIISDPHIDPYFVCRRTNFTMKTYLQMEMEYAKRCVAEQNVQKQLECKVFEIMQEIPVEHGVQMSAMIDESNEMLSLTEQRVHSFHALTDWTAFETKYTANFIPENIQRLVLDETNHPDDSGHTRFQHVFEPELEIYHKLGVKKGLSDGKINVESSLLAKCKDFTNKVRSKQRGFAVRGAWYVSTDSYLIEFDERQHSTITIFDLRKVRVSDLAPDEHVVYGYFTLRGRKVRLDGEEKRGRERDYKFRLPWEKARVFHQVLRSCGSKDDQVAINDDEVSSASSASSLSGDTTLVSRQTSHV